MITKATYAGSSNTMCTIEPSMAIVPANDPQVTEWVNAGNTIFPYEPPSQTADEARTAKLSELKSTYEEQSVVSVGSAGFVWNGGEASAHRINGKAETMLHMSTPLGSIYDVDNIPHEMSAQSIKDIAADISVSYELVFTKYQVDKNEVQTCGDNIICINAVTW